MNNKIEKQAVDWFVRLRASDVTSAERHAHSDWLQSNDDHQAAYDHVCREWAELDDMNGWARSELAQLNLASSSRIRRSVNLSMLSFATAAVVVLAVLLWPLVGMQPERYQTEKAEQRQITLEDGSRLHLNSATEIEVDYEDEIRVITLNQGEGIFDVETDTQRPFLVRAGGNNIIALGTRFSVEYRAANEVEVTVLEGKVAVVPEHEAIVSVFKDVPFQSVEDLLEKEARSVILERDQQVVVARSEILPIVEVDAANETAWREGRLIFNGTPLREVVTELSLYVPGHIRVAENVPDYPVTGIIHIRSTENMLEFLSEVVPITPVKQSASLTVVHATPAQPSNG